MKFSKACSVLAIASLVGFALGSSDLAKGASDQVPREWKEMSFQDIDPSPFQWDANGVCKVQEHNGPTRQCYLQLKSSLVTQWPLYLHLVVRWYEKEPSKAHLAYICEHPGERWQRYEAAAEGRAAIITHAIWRAQPPSERQKEELQKSFPPQATMRILNDILSRIEFYAIPCPRGGVRGAGSVAVNDPASQSGSATGQVDVGSIPLPPVRVKPGGNPLGQGDEAPGITGVGDGNQARATRRAGGFPPDVKVTALRFFPSAAQVGPREGWNYTTRFDDRVEYIETELNISYPEGRDLFSFEMHVKVFKDGQFFTEYSQRDMSIEPGNTSSYHVAGWGKQGGGYWKPGNYRVEVSVKGSVVATGEFEIVAARG